MFLFLSNAVHNSPFVTVMCQLLTFLILAVLHTSKASLPTVITTWQFRNATIKAWDILKDNGTAMDAIEQGCSVCEVEQCDRTVGYGGSPDENGETTLDAMMMDGDTFNVGAVANLRRIKSAISVARKVLVHTEHSMLAGDQATEFALEMGFKEESLTTQESKDMWSEWRANNCQPNYWVDVTPDPSKNCGPYSPLHPNDIFMYNYGSFVEPKDHFSRGGIHDHDTIGMVAIDIDGHMVAGTSTNGLKHKIPGRVGDSPIAGAGAYADSSVGGAAATGDGDVMLRFLPSYQAVESMRQGHPPAEAARIAMQRIIAHYPKFEGAIIAINKDGLIGAACFGFESFPFNVATPEFGHVDSMSVDCLK